MRQGFRAVAVLAVAGLIGLAAGCGGGDGGSGSTTRTIMGRTITVPTISSPGMRSMPTTTPTTITLPSGQTIGMSQLAPFRDCLRRHGVQPLPLNSPPPSLRSLTPARIAQLRSQFRARGACAPFLPSPLRERFEQYRKQLQQRRQGR